jgi:hypothetical protein
MLIHDRLERLHRDGARNSFLLGGRRGAITGPITLVDP